MNTSLLDEIRKEAMLPWHIIGRPLLLPVAGGALGGGVGALADRNNRLRGALIGTGLDAGLGLAGSALLNRTLAGQHMQLRSTTNRFFSDEPLKSMLEGAPELKRKGIDEVLSWYDTKLPFNEFRNQMKQVDTVRDIMANIWSGLG